MKHARPDYDRIQDPTGLIPSDEPVMLFRAQDRHAATALRIYANLVAASPGHDPEVVRLTRQQADLMDRWPRKKEPDLPVGAASS